MISRICPSCHRKIEYGKICPCGVDIKRNRNRIYDKCQRNKSSDAFYHSKEWKQVKENISSIYVGIDIYAYYEHGHLEYADIIHHIKEVKEDWEERLSTDNLIPVSKASHAEIHAEMKKNKAAIQAKLMYYKEKWKKEYGTGHIQQS